MHGDDREREICNHFMLFMKYLHVVCWPKMEMSEYH